MPYRRLPEMGHAREQIDRDVLRRLRTLERRVRYPGVRRAVEADSVTVSTGVAAVYLRMNVERGSWSVLAGLNYDSTVVDTPTNNTVENCRVEIVVKDGSGAVMDGVGPPAKWTWRGSAGAGLRMPFTLFGHGHWEDNMVLELYVSLSTGGTAHQVALTDLCLQVTPV